MVYLRLLLVELQFLLGIPASRIPPPPPPHHRFKRLRRSSIGILLAQKIGDN